MPLLCGIWPLVSYRNAEFMNNEVPGASVPGRHPRSDAEDRRRRKRASRKAWRSRTRRYQRVRGEVAGVQLAAPMGRIDGALSILDTHAG